LPLICPLAGLLGSIWHRGRIMELDAARLRGGMIALCIGYAVGAVVLLRIGPGAAPLTVTVGAGVIAGTGALWTAVNWYWNRTMRGAWGLAGLVVLLCLAFGSYWTRQRTARSAYAAAQQVRAITGGAGRPIMTWYMLWAQPELFYYADIQAVPVRFGKEPPPLTEGWILLYQGSEIDEGAAWPHWAGSAGSGAALTRPTTLRVNKAQAVLAWYTAAPRAAFQSTSGPSRVAP
jgi:hypothetical protein